MIRLFIDITDVQSIDEAYKKLDEMINNEIANCSSVSGLFSCSTEYSVTYRDEFYARIFANTPEEARKVFMSGEADYQLMNELHSDFVKVTEEQ